MADKKICICGMGFVGLTLSVVLARVGYEVFGVETSPEVLGLLKQGQPHFHEPGLDTSFRTYLNRSLYVSGTIPDVDIDAFIISVGTPLGPDLAPSLRELERAVKSILPKLRDGVLVALRSTVPVGTTREMVLALLDSAGVRFHLAYCPERTIEGRALDELQQLPQIIGGRDAASVQQAAGIFRRVTPVVIEVSSLETAEVIKLLDNSYRDYMFAFSNEMAMTCSYLGVDAYEAIRAANTAYGRNNIPVPGLVGGICLTKDPRILGWSAKKAGYQLQIDSRSTNERYTSFILDRCEIALERAGKNLSNAAICVAGFAFKGSPPTDDLRNSPTLNLLSLIRQRGGARNTIYGQDFLVSAAALAELGVQPVELGRLPEVDLLILANNHPQYRLTDVPSVWERLRRPAVVMDVWRLWDRKLLMALGGIIYVGDSLLTNPATPLVRSGE